MRAAVLTTSRPTLEVVELPDPTPAPGEVVVRVTGCAGLVTEVISLEELPDRFAHLGQHSDTGKVIVAP